MVGALGALLCAAVLARVVEPLALVSALSIRPKAAFAAFAATALKDSPSGPQGKGSAPTIKRRRRPKASTGAEEKTPPQAASEASAKGADRLSTPRLKVDEQLALARSAQRLLRWERVKADLAKSLGRPPTEAEWLAATDFYGDVTAFDRERVKSREAKAAMVAANMGLVFGIARRYQWKGLAYDDLVQEGTFGLAKAVDKFDTERGLMFSTYAMWWVKQAVAAAVMDQGRAIRLPSHVNKQVVQLDTATRKIVAALGREPRREELEATLNLTTARVSQLQEISSSNHVFSYDATTTGASARSAAGSQRALVDGLSDEACEREGDAAGLRKDIATALEAELTPRELRVIRLRFGLEGDRPWSNREIAEELGCAKETVRLLQIKALDKLKKTRYGEALETYMTASTR